MGTINVKHEHQWGAIDYAMEVYGMPDTKQPHYKCARCDTGKFHLGGFSGATKHTKEDHPGLSMDVRIEMRWPIGVEQ